MEFRHNPFSAKQITMNRWFSSIPTFSNEIRQDEDGDAELSQPSSGDFESVCEQPEPFCGQRHWFVPIHYTKSYAYPLVVWLHSDHHNPRQIEAVMPHVSLRNFVGVGVCGNRSLDPTGVHFGWHDSDAGVTAAGEAVIRAVQAAQSAYNIHPERIILAGYQSGGTMAIRLAMMSPNHFGAAVSLGGRMPASWKINDYDRLRKRRLPLLWQWGSGNPNYTQVGLTEDCQMAMRVGGKVEIRQYPGDDEMDTVVLSDLNQWIMRTVVAPTQHGSCESETVPVSYSVN